MTEVLLTRIEMAGIVLSIIGILLPLFVWLWAQPAKEIEAKMSDVRELVTLYHGANHRAWAVRAMEHGLSISASEAAEIIDKVSDSRLAEMHSEQEDNYRYFSKGLTRWGQTKETLSKLLDNKLFVIGVLIALVGIMLSSASVIGKWLAL